jgi:hypothetical protein
MLETPILIVDHRAGDRCSRVVALSLMGRWSCCDAQSLTGVDPVTPLRIEFANRVNYVVRVRPR